MSSTPGATQSDGQLLRRLRRNAGWSLAQLANVVHYDKGYLSRVENDRQTISVALATACDRALNTNGELTARAEAAARPGHQFEPLAQLPAAPSHIVGRDDSLARLAELLGDHQSRPGAVPVIAVDGPPGVGKTALAVRYAHAIADGYPGGVLFANLRGYGPTEPVDPGQVLNGFLRSLGAHPDRIPAGQDDRAALFRSLISGRGVLVVLDNAADSSQVRPLLPGSPDCAVLLTSRQRLTGLLLSTSAACVTLNPLGPADAAALMRSVIGERLDAEAAAVAQVAHRCAYLPLALSIAAVRIAAHPHQSIADLAADLAAEHERLDVLASGNDDMLSVRGVFSWSYQALAPEVARLFRLLGLHPGTGFSSGAASALVGLSHPVARRQLEGLTAAHLVEDTGRDRYQLHDLLRVYAAELAYSVDTDNDREAAVRRLVDWYLASTDAAVRVLTPRRPHVDLPTPLDGVHPARFRNDYDQALAWCDTELSTMVGITRLAADHHLCEQAWRLPVTWFDYFLLRQPWDEWIAAHELGVVAARDTDDALGHGWTLTNLAEAHRRRGELDIAEQQFRAALEICPERSSRGWALAGIAFTLCDRKEFRAAIKYLKQMADVFGEINMVFGIATAYANLSDAYRELGDLDRAWSTGRRAYELYLSIRDRQGQGYALTRLARTARQRGDRDAALAYCVEAVAANRESGDRWGEADALEVHGRLLRDIGDDLAAAGSLESALAIFADGLDERRAGLLRAELQDAPFKSLSDSCHEVDHHATGSA
ncbi:MAG TPA: helix-turn-helix domain-containing protein [Pseudonocardiaceae bacterium]|nr:helix-turn-helix domain-containing protein [Pseudonocardiaceae bacterium]